MKNYIKLSNNKPNYQIIKNFIPSWFASVMGTGVFALTSYFYSIYIPSLKLISIFLFYFNIILFLILLIPWLLRWILFFNNAYSDLNNPVSGNFFPTIAVGLLVLSANFIIIGKNILIGKILWFSGVILTVFFAFLIPYIVFTKHDIEIHHINPGWFIPPVALIVIPIPGGLLIHQFHGILKEIVILINIFGFGAGFFLYIALFSIVLYRFIIHSPLPDVLAPTIWINLGPIGAGTSALINIVKFCNLIVYKHIMFFIASLFWAFGIWWIIMSIIMTLHYIKKVKFPYTMAWWALTFPLGAFVTASHSISMALKIKLIDYFGLILFFLLAYFWIITFYKTLKKTLNGSLFSDKK